LEKEQGMRRNIGMLDLAVRLVIGFILIAFALRLGFPETGWNWVGWIGIMPLATATIRNCPLYSVLGISTRGRRARA
jgi:hypothetical protein